MNAGARAMSALGFRWCVRCRALLALLLLLTNSREGLVTGEELDVLVGKEDGKVGGSVGLAGPSDLVDRVVDPCGSLVYDADHDLSEYAHQVEDEG